MRITHIAVEGLFGRYDHDIPLNNDERITILHGPNGVGKTTILRLVDYLFQGRYFDLSSVSFGELTVSMDDGSHISLCDLIADMAGPYQDQTSFFNHWESERSRSDLRIRCLREGAPVHVYSPFADENMENLFPLSLIDKRIPSLERIGPREWRNRASGSVLSYNEVLLRFGDMLPIGHSESKGIPEWLSNIQRTTTVHLIETQRLLRYPSRKKVSTIGDRNTREYEDAAMDVTVAAYAIELASQFEETLAASVKLSQQLDRTFPNRVMHRQADTALTVRDLRSKLASLEQRRRELENVGLLVEDTNIGSGVAADIDSTMRTVLTVYVEDAARKLSTFDDLAKRVEIFRTLLADRFIDKDFVVSQDQGFYFTNPDGVPIEPRRLSSGEQHQVILQYELAFKTPPGALVMIDEPELSLHVAWQERFLRDLQRVADIGDFDAILATHSPQIIGSRWDLCVGLDPAN